MIVEIRDEVVTLSGTLRRNRWATLQSAVNVRLRHHPAGIVVDCGGLQLLTPEGARTFRDAAQHIVAGGGRIVLANVPPEVMQVLRQTPNLGSQLPIAATVADARASLGLEISRPRSVAGGGTGTAVAAGLLGTEADSHAVAMACRLAYSMQATVYLIYLLVVPRNKPLLAALGDQEEAARGALERLEAAVRTARLRPAPRVERTRDPAGRLVAVASEVRADAITLALPPGSSEELNALAEAVLARADCDVVINRLPAPQSGAVPAAPVLIAGGGRH